MLLSALGPFLYDGSPEAEAWFRELVAKHPDRSDTDILRDYERGEEWCRPPGALPPYDPEDPFADMEHSTDDYGREIFVEHRTDDGRPAVWYQYNSAGILQKKTRTSNGIHIEKANVNLFGKRAH